MRTHANAPAQLLAGGRTDRGGPAAGALPTATTYGGVVLGMVMLGAGAGLVIPASTGAVMGSLPSAHTGVGSATNGAFMQVGGAVGVAVIGSLLSTRYQSCLGGVLGPYRLPHAIQHTISGSLGAALTFAERLGGVEGAMVARLARSAFLDGMDLSLTVAGAVALAGALLALLAFPSKAGAENEHEGGSR